MDGTYKTDKYNLHFLEIVGVTSINKTFSIAFAFMHNEKTSNYIWALTCLKLTINDSFCPRVIVTDRDAFPQSNHLLCRWHIFNDITKHCRQRIKPQKTWNSFHLKWKKLVESPTLNEYMQNYADLQTLLFEYADVLDYLYTVWLGKYAERFVSLWTDKHVNFGNSTTNRVESLHAKLKKHLESAKCLRIGYSKYCENMFQCMLWIKTWKSFIDQKDLYQLLRIVDVNCGHVLDYNVLTNLGCSPIPLDSIDGFWRKLDLKPSISVEYGDLNVDYHMQRFKEIYNNKPDHIKSSSFMDLNDDPDRHSSIFMGSYEEPISQCLYNINLNEEPIAVCLGYGEDQLLYIHQQLLDELLSSYDDYVRVFIGCNEEFTSLSFFMKTKSAPTKH
ncbi:unnamed protein product [Lactuca saligna]|uniref:MULE transposase domain-containing protein n=1 Tax=Lactuca saligna TaxID=75948 RepID=A0AA35YK15_LACSI|nr:unnamed protein product [Lactuca saligna]